MLRLTVYSKALCVQCQGVLRNLGIAVDKGRIDAADVEVINVDGSPRDPKKVHEGFALTSTPVEKQDAMRDYLKDTLGHAQSPVVVLTRDDEIVYHNQGMRPGDLKNLVGMLEAQRQEKAREKVLASA